MLSILKPFLAALAALALTDWLLPTVTFSSWHWLLAASVLFVILYSLVRPILSILLLPFNIVTLGLVNTLLNGLLLWLMLTFLPGFEVKAMILFGARLNFIFSLMLTTTIISTLAALIRRLLR